MNKTVNLIATFYKDIGGKVTSLILYNIDAFQTLVDKTLTFGENNLHFVDVLLTLLL